MTAQPLVSASTFDLVVIYGALFILIFLAAAHLWERSSKRNKRAVPRMYVDAKPASDGRKTAHPEWDVTEGRIRTP